MSALTDKVDAMWTELMATTKPGEWAKDNPNVPGHWLNSRKKKDQIKAEIVALEKQVAQQGAGGNFGSGTMGG